MASLPCALLFSFVLPGLISKSYAITLCGDNLCSGSCCGDICCHQVWDIWWFWLIWVTIFLVMTACAFCCRRQRAVRLHRQQFVVVQQPINPTPAYGFQDYGAVGNSECAPIVYAPLVAGRPNLPTYGYASTQAPPAYTPAAKPPEYTPTV